MWGRKGYPGPASCATASSCSNLLGDLTGAPRNASCEADGPASQLFVILYNLFTPKFIGKHMGKQISREDVTADFVRRRFDYNAETGDLIYSGRERAHLPPSMRSRRTGRKAGWKDSHGYLMVKIGKFDYLLHRLIWLHQTGSWPALQIDHINGVRDDNRWENLRVATGAVNGQNKWVAASGTSSKELGVSKSKTQGRWMANISANGVLMRLGTFCSEEAALAAYLNAKIVVHPESPLVEGLTFEPGLLTRTARRNLLRGGFSV